MRRSRFRLPSGFFQGSLLVFSLWATSCASGSDERDTDSISSEEALLGVCPSCEVKVGGETSDFDGATAACSEFYESSALDADAAKGLGVDVAALSEVIDRQLDEPFRWSPQPPSNGAPATGYQALTRIQLTSRILGYTHFVLSPTSCDAGTCIDENGQTTESDPCRPYAVVRIEVEYRTLDDSVRGVAEGRVLWGLGSTEADGSPFDPETGELEVGASSDLTDVIGKLRLHPDAGGMPVGSMKVSLSFTKAVVRGSLEPSVRFQSSSDAGEPPPRYAPLMGHFPADE